MIALSASRATFEHCHYPHLSELTGFGGANPDWQSKAPRQSTTYIC